MSKPIPHHALIVVADGAKAIFLRNQGQGGEVSLHEEKRLLPKDVADDGPSGVRPDDQTFKQADEAGFVKHLAQALTRMKEAKGFEDLVLICDPQTLGQLRAAMHKNVEASVLFTLSKDLTNHAVKDIEKSLS